MEIMIKLLLLLFGAVLTVHSQSACPVSGDFITVTKGIARYVKPSVGGGKTGHCCQGQPWCDVVGIS